MQSPLNVGDLNLRSRLRVEADLQHQVSRRGYQLDPVERGGHGNTLNLRSQRHEFVRQRRTLTDRKHAVGRLLGQLRQTREHRPDLGKRAVGNGNR